MSLTRRLIGSPVSVESVDGSTSFAFPALNIPRGSLVKAYFRYEDADVGLSVTDTAGGKWRVIRQFNGNVSVALAWSWNHPGGTEVQITGQLATGQSWRFGAAWAESGGDLADPAILGSMVATSTAGAPLNHFVKSDPFADTTHVSGCYNNASGATVANSYLRAVHASAYSLSAVILGRRLPIRQAAFTVSAGNTASISLAFRAPAAEYAQARSLQRRILVAVPSGGTSHTLDAAAQAAAAASAALSVQSSVQLGGTAQAQASASATLLKGVTLAAASIAQAGASASLAHGVPLAASAAAVAASSAGLALGVTLSASAIASAAASAGLAVTAQNALSANAVAQASGSAVLSLQVVLSASAVAQAAAAASASVGKRLAANAVGEAGGSAALLVGAPTDLSAGAQAQASAGAQLAVEIPLSAQALAQAMAAGSLTVAVRLQANALAAASATAVLSEEARLSAGAVAMASAQALLQVLPEGVFTANSRMRLGSAVLGVGSFGVQGRLGGTALRSPGSRLGVRKP